MVIIGRGQPTHLVSQNKRICLWHRQLANTSNARVVRASKLVDNIELGPEKEYDLAEVLIDWEESDADDTGDQSLSMTNSIQPYTDLSSAIRQMKAGIDKERQWQYPGKIIYVISRKQVNTGCKKG